MSLGQSIAAEVAAALAEGSAAVGDGPFYVTLMTKVPDDTTVFPPVIGGTAPINVLALQSTQRLRDQNGNLLTVTRTTLTIEAGKVAPKMGDKVQIDAAVYQVAEVIPFAPGGVPIYYDLDVVRA